MNTIFSKFAKCICCTAALDYNIRNTSSGYTFIGCFKCSKYKVIFKNNILEEYYFNLLLYGERIIINAEIEGFTYLTLNNIKRAYEIYIQLSCPEDVIPVINKLRNLHLLA